MKKYLPLVVFILCLTIQTNSQIALISSSNGGFENATSTLAANGWTAVNTTAPAWFAGTAGGSVAGGTKSAYFGSSTTYNGATAAVVKHFYRDIAIPAGATQVYLNYYLKFPTIDCCTYEDFYIFTTTTANTPVSNTLPTTGYTQRVKYNTPALANFTAQSQIDLTSLAGTTVRLVFTLKSDANTPYGNPAVDNITLTYVPACTLPTPTTQASNITFTNIASNGMTVNWTRGATPGDGVIVLIRSGSAVNANPVDGATYTAVATSPTGGTQVGTGNYVVYQGNGTSVNLTGLTQGTTYYVSVYEKNCLGASSKYNTTSPATGFESTLGVVTASSGTWTVPANVYSVRAMCWGGGGGGGGAYAGSCTGGGGGGGGAFSSVVFSVTPGQTFTVVVGAAGTAGTSAGTSAANGGAGGVSSAVYNGPGGGTCSANGGPGGNGVLSSDWGTSKPGVAGGTGGTGFLYAGGNGGASYDGSWSGSGGGGGGAGSGAAGGNPTETGSQVGGTGGIGGTLGYPGGAGGDGYCCSGNTAAGRVGTAPGGGGSGASTASCGSSAGNSGGAGGAGRVIFTYTITLCSAPSVSATPAATSIGCTTASFVNANVSADGGCNITERGVVYAVSPTVPTTSNGKTAVAGTTGNFTANVTGLAASTTYIARAFATNGNGTTYGTQVSFTTSPVPGQPNAITPTTACANTATVFTTSATNSPTSYTWTLPGGWSGSSTSATISATPNATSGSISVTATNACGTSAIRTTAITIPAPVAPTLSTITNP